ncbi:Putative transposase of IS4/5 family [Nitrosomonas cryotolerans]|nr:Putative transposase of IS4/5 family [Nitrosomonas cryotolerans]
MRTGAPWRNLPSDHGSWKSTRSRSIRWCGKGIWLWMRIGMSARVFITQGTTTADCTRVDGMIKGLDAEFVGGLRL